MKRSCISQIKELESALHCNKILYFFIESGYYKESSSGRRFGTLLCSQAHSKRLPQPWHIDIGQMHVSTLLSWCKSGGIVKSSTSCKVTFLDGLLIETVKRIQAGELTIALGMS